MEKRKGWESERDGAGSNVRARQREGGREGGALCNVREGERERDGGEGGE